MIGKAEQVTLSHRPDDYHVHFRLGKRMQAMVKHTAWQFARAIVMPNTKPHILTVDDAAKYRDQILSAVPSDTKFEPLMTLYLNKETNPDMIRQAKKSGFVHGMKMYPGTKPGGQELTTNSAEGVVDVRDVADQLAVMQEIDMPLLVHGESGDPSVDVFRRETVFYREVMNWIVETFPKLRIVCEHITTDDAVEFVRKAPKHIRIGATITPQHMLVNRNYMLGGSLRPHAFCKPILKDEIDRLAVLHAATSGDSRFFLGTDSAPHPKHGPVAKEGDCGCAGCFTAHAALELYAEAFDTVGHLARLDDFASKFGANFYELPRNNGKVTLVRKEWKAVEQYQFGDGEVVVPFRQEEPLQWQMAA